LLDFSFQVRQTTVHVRYAEITRVPADAFVSSDDVHLSGASGLSRAIHAAAGKPLVAELRKFELPRPVGSVLVTSGGDLPAKYVLHAITISYDEQPYFETLVPRVVSRGLDICAALEVETLAMPMLNAGIINAPIATMLTVLSRSAACYLARNDSPLRQITLAVYDDEVDDHAAAEERLEAELEPVRATIEGWQLEARPLNERLTTLLPAIEALADDRDLQSQLRQRADTLVSQLLDGFGCPPPPEIAPELVGLVARVGVLNDRAAYEKAQKNLQNSLADLEEQIAQENETLRQLRRSRNKLEQQAAGFGLNVPLEISNGLDDANARMENKQREIDLLTQRQANVQQQLDALNRNWSGRDNMG
jgi:O-acetyl-ADP-ribose deacetylase (regulator of RNase III)